MKDYSFGNYICALRMGLGLSQFQLGTLVGVTDKAVSKWENGDAKPRVATCYRLADVLGVSISELLSCEKRDTAQARKELDKMNKDLWKEAYNRLYEIYGDQPPLLCWSRLASEENALAGTDAVQSFAVVGRIESAAKEHNCLTINAGAINSSFAAWLFGATKVNPLPPHYRCLNCKKTEFVQDVRDGFDLEPKKCTCGAMLVRDGHDLPYEGYAKAEHKGTFVDLRVSDSFRPTAVKAVMDFYQETAEVLPVKLEGNDPQWTLERYIVLPKDREKPKVSHDGFWHTGDDAFREWHECTPAFNFISNKQLNVIDQMQRRRNCHFPDAMDLADKAMAERLFQDRAAKLAFITDALSVDEPHDFDLIFRLDSMSHASGAWEGNGKQLVQSDPAVFRRIPACREDVYKAVENGLRMADVQERGLALQIMEDTRKGKYHSKGMPDQLEKLLQTLKLPEWYPECLKKIQYLFPKGHCVAYVMIDLAYEWFRLNYPKEFADCTETVK